LGFAAFALAVRYLPIFPEAPAHPAERVAAQETAAGGRGAAGGQGAPRRGVAAGGALTREGA
jgi:hypothetical protein